MKKLIASIFFVFACNLYAQNIVQAEYFVDTDPGFGSGTPITVGAPASDVTLNFSVDTTAVSGGFHILYVRGKDTNGHWSMAYNTPFYKSVSLSNPLANIVKLEYFVDIDPGLGIGTNVPVTPGTDVTQTFSVNLTAVSGGFHILYVRSKDSNGQWTVNSSQPFYKPVSFSNPLANITKLEYFIDTDPGLGSGTNVPVTPGTDITQTFSVNLTAVSGGFHILYVRSKDSDGLWTVNYSQPFYKPVSLSNPLANITKLEYFIDTDPGFGSGTNVPITPGTDVTQTFSVNLTAVSGGFHILYVRSIDSDGLWTVNYSQPFYKPVVITPNLPNVTSINYFFSKRGVNSSLFSYSGFTPSNDVNVTFSPNLASLTIDSTYDFHIFGNDANGRRSLDYIQTFVAGDIPPAAPQNLVATAGDGQVVLKWKKNTEPDFLRYRIYGGTSTNPTSRMDSTNLISDTTKTVVNLANGTTYYFRVTAVDNIYNESGYSNEVNRTPADLTPPVPTAFVINGGATVTNNVNVSLTLGATGADSMKITGSVTGGNVNRYLTYATSKNVSLTSGDGTKIVNVVFKDLSGNTSSAVSDTILLSLPPVVTTAIYQNPALSKYLDVIVVSQSGLLSNPSYKLWRIGNAEPSFTTMGSIPNATRAYQGSGEFDQSGTYNIRILATAVGGSVKDSTRQYSVTLAKPGQLASVVSLDGKAKLVISENSIREATYFLSGFEKEGNEMVYRFGPEKEYPQSLRFELNYENNAYTDVGKLFVYTRENGEWKALRTQVYPGEAKVKAYITTLGEFKLTYDPNYTGTNLVPTTFALKQNYPNPFNPTTTITYDIAEDGKLLVVIYNLLGQKVKTLYDGNQLAGSYMAIWDGKNESGQSVTTGIYFYRVQSGRFVQIKKMLLLR